MSKISVPNKIPSTKMSGLERWRAEQKQKAQGAPQGAQTPPMPQPGPQSGPQMPAPLPTDPQGDPNDPESQDISQALGSNSQDIQNIQNQGAPQGGQGEEAGEGIQIKILNGGGFVLSNNGDEYGYEDKDQLLKAISDEIVSMAPSQDGGMANRKQNVASLIGGQNEA